MLPFYTICRLQKQSTANMQTGWKLREKKLDITLLAIRHQPSSVPVLIHSSYSNLKSNEETNFRYATGMLLSLQIQLLTSPTPHITIHFDLSSKRMSHGRTCCSVCQ